MTRMQKLYLKEQEGRKRWRVRRLVLTAATITVLTLGGGVALADPDFGPGQTQNVGPQDPNAKCHPPGLELPSPECK
jgi:hypothetical protein